MVTVVGRIPTYFANCVMEAMEVMVGTKNMSKEKPEGVITKETQAN